MPEFYPGVAGPVARPLTCPATIRDALQELHDSTEEQLQQIREELRAIRAGMQPARPGLVTRLVKAGVKFGVLTIIAAIISGPVTEAESDIMHWSPPPVTVVREMTPAQMDELARQIENHHEQQARRLEKQEDKHPPGRRTP